MPDSLTRLYSLPPLGDSTTGWAKQTGSAAEIFGNESHLSVQVVNSAAAWGDSLSGTLHWQIGITLVLLLILICYCYYRYSKAIKSCLSAAFSIGETIYIYRQSTVELNHFTFVSKLIILLSIATALVGAMGADQTYQLATIAALVVSLIAIGTLKCWIGWLISQFDHNKERWSNIRYVTLLDRSVSAMFFCLPAIIFSFYPSMQITLIVLGCVLIGYHFFRLLLFFIGNGFSFLQWILYLCAVEIAPFALAWGVFIRFNDIYF